MQQIVIIAGPTASGKSARALERAKRENGIVINADAMQLYRELRILTARPAPEEERHVPHRLYGISPASEPTSAGKWLGLAKQAIKAAWTEGKLPIVVGGTGLYLKTLMHGIAEIPDVPEEVRQKVRDYRTQLSGKPLHRLLGEKDPIMAARLKPGDTQRILRALEVLEATGRSLAEWQEVPPLPPYPLEIFEVEVMEVPRLELYARCDARFLKMLEEGALEEVRALLALNLPNSLPAMRAVGVPELAAHLRGEISLKEAISRAQQATRNYAKRQLTWLRHQLEPRVND